MNWTTFSQESSVFPYLMSWINPLSVHAGTYCSQVSPSVCTHPDLLVLAELSQRVDQGSVQQPFAHLRLLHEQTVGGLTGHGQGVVRLIPALGSSADDTHQLRQGFTSLGNKDKQKHKFTLVEPKQQITE